MFESLFCHTDESAREEEEQASQQGTAGGLNAIGDLETPETGLKQVHLLQYPVCQFGAQQRPFNKSWFEHFKWLQYSVVAIKMPSVALGFQIERGLWSMRKVPSM